MIVELRQYTMVPRRREALVELFEREFVDGHEELGAPILGTFRDLDDPDRFVWLRSFTDMASRRAALRSFYGGPVWAAHREAANATMVDFDDVLLLRPVDGELPHRAWPRRVLVVVHVPAGTDEPDADAARRTLGRPLAVLRTADEVNDFPALPVRTDRAVVWCVPDGTGARGLLEAEPSWRVAGDVRFLELEPTPRSAGET